jgi:hypothetical protein
LVQSCGEPFDECISQFSSALSDFDAFTLHFANAISIVLVLYGLYGFVGRGVTVAISQSIVLQVRLHFPPHFLIYHHHNQLLGILLARTALSHPSQAHLASSSFVLLVVVLVNAWNVFTIDMVPFTPPFARIGN